MVRDFFVGPVRYDMILSMPWVTYWKARPPVDSSVIEVCVPDKREKAHLPVSTKAPTSLMVSGIRSAPSQSEDELKGKQLENEVAADGDMHALPLEKTEKDAILAIQSYFPPRSSRSGRHLRPSLRIFLMIANYQQEGPLLVVHRTALNLSPARPQALLSGTGDLKTGRGNREASGKIV